MKEVVSRQTIQELAFYTASVEPKTFQDIMGANTPSFKVIAREHGEEKLRAILVVELTKICQLLSFTVKGEMIVESAKNIADEFWYCKPDDIKLFKTYLFRNKLPVELYRNDALVLYRLFEEYEIIRHREFSNAAELKYRAEKAEMEKQPVKTLYEAAPAFVRENIDRLDKKIQERKEAINEKVYTGNKTLEQIIEIAGLNLEQVSEQIRNNAKANFSANKQPGETLELYLSYELGQVTYEARRNPEFLKKYVGL